MTLCFVFTVVVHHNDHSRWLLPAITVVTKEMNKRQENKGKREIYVPTHIATLQERVLGKSGYCIYMILWEVSYWC